MGLKLIVTMSVALLIVGCATQPEPDDDRVDRDVVYGHKEGTALFYDVLKPEEPNGAGIVYMVSGGWYSVWVPPEEARARFEPVLAEGFTIFAVHHASAPRFKVPEAVSDVRAALRHIKLNATNYGVSPDRLGVFGGSAGGHLSLMLGLNAEGRSDPPQGSGYRSLGPHYLAPADAPADVAAIVAYYPPVDIRSRVGPSDRFPALDFPREQAAAISPLLFVSPDDPPTKLIHGDADELVPLVDSEILTGALAEAGVVHDLLVIEGGDHGFRNPVHRKQATDAMIKWFSEHLN